MELAILLEKKDLALSKIRALQQEYESILEEIEEINSLKPTGFIPTEDSVKEFFIKKGDGEWFDDQGKHFWGLDDFSFKSGLTLNGWQVKERDASRQIDEEDIWVVLEFQKDGVSKFFQANGWYSSYNGARYDSVKEVTPAEKVITVWK
jgi:hypothetical protein